MFCEIVWVDHFQSVLISHCCCWYSCYVQWTMHCWQLQAVHRSHSQLCRNRAILCIQVQYAWTMNIS